MSWEFQTVQDQYFPRANGNEKNDFVIICGDFGGVWNKDGESKMETKMLDWLDCKPFTTLFVDENHDNSVDFIVSHCASSSTAAQLSQGAYKPDILTDYFEEIRQNVKFKKWFFGHYHGNRNVNAKEILLWEQIIRIV